jgi:hypothetical protein
LIFAVAFGQGAVRSQHAEKRDLAKYDNGGTFNFTWEVAPDHEQMRAKLREFIWQHWHQKRWGRAMATFYTIEGDPSTYNFYIEATSEGRWRVVSEYEIECCWFYAMDKKKKKRKVERGVDVYDVVVRIADVKSSGFGSEEIGESEIRESTLYRLRLGRGSQNGKSDTSFLL